VEQNIRPRSLLYLVGCLVYISALLSMAQQTERHRTSLYRQVLGSPRVRHIFLRGM